MSLSDRLQRARNQQLMEAGLLPRTQLLVEREEPAVDVVDEEPVPEEHSHGLFAPITIEARPAGLFLVAEPAINLTDLPETAAPNGADSATCPTCNAVGAVDMIDLVGHTVHYTCGSCSTMWQVRKPVVTESLP